MGLTSTCSKRVKSLEANVPSDRWKVIVMVSRSSVMTPCRCEPDSAPAPVAAAAAAAAVNIPVACRHVARAVERGERWSRH